MQFKNIFAIGDIHGCATELRLLLHQLPLNAKSLVVFLGDYIDRGPDSKGVVDTIIELRDLYRVVTLMGNHEEMFSQFLQAPDSPQAGVFLMNGGSATLASYSPDGTNFEIPDKHKEFYADLNLFFETKDYFFVHAGVPQGFDFDDPLKNRFHDDFLWIRGPFLRSTDPREKIVVHGHTPVAKPEILNNRINLDTGCVFGQRLTAIELPGNKLYSVERNEASQIIHLEHVFSDGIRRPKRFEGKIPVFIETDRPDAFDEYETVNYSQFGLLMKEKKLTSDNKLQIGSNVKGFIEDTAGRKVHFHGEVVRASSASYALKITVDPDV